MSTKELPIQGEQRCQAVSGNGEGQVSTSAPADTTLTLAGNPASEGGEVSARKNAQALAIIETVEVVTRRLGKVRGEVSRGHLATARGYLLLAQDDIETALKALLKV